MGSRVEVEAPVRGGGGQGGGQGPEARSPEREAGGAPGGRRTVKSEVVCGQSAFPREA